MPFKIYINFHVQKSILLMLLFIQFLEALYNDMQRRDFLFDCLIHCQNFPWVDKGFDETTSRNRLPRNEYQRRIFMSYAILHIRHASFTFDAECYLKRKELPKKWYTQIFIVHKQTSAKFFWHCKKYKISKEIETMCLLTMVYTYAPQHINYFWNGV